MIDSDTGATPLSLLEPDEPPAVEIVNAGGSGSVVLVCDHASNRVPRRLCTLGLEAAQLSDHIGWDPGAAEVARRLSLHLDAPLVLSGYSRLVIDCNRPLHSVQSIPEQSAGVSIPGNRALTPEGRAMRTNELFLPYHGAIDQLLDSRTGRLSLLLSIHSFTSIFSGISRPWHIGVSYWRKREFADLMRGALTLHRDIIIGDNEPYPIEDETDYTIPVHGEGRGLPSAMIEIRQDSIQTTDAAAAWAARLAEAYRLIESEALNLFK